MNDYFSKKLGYIIEERNLGGRENAKKYLVKACDMTSDEADSYLARLRNAYFANRKGAEING